MLTSSRRLTVLLLTTASGLSAQQAAQCHDGGGARGDLGIRQLRCEAPAAACTINVTDSAGRLGHQFSVEPVIAQVVPDIGSPGPRVGDVLVAVDSLLITTRQGGRRLANLIPGEAIPVLVRRDGRLLELRMEVGRGCGITSLGVVRPGSAL